VPVEPRKNVGMLGISYGAGPVFVAAAGYTKDIPIRFLISVGGYFDFAHFLNFVVRGVHESNGEQHFRQAQAWARFIFALNYLTDFIDADTEEIRKILWLRLNSKDQEAERAASALPANSAEFINEVISGFSDRNMKIFRKIMIRDRETHARISPASIIAKLNPRMHFYLLHGKNDDLVPYEETLELERALRQNGKETVRSLITASLTHVDFKESEDLVGAISLLFWLTRVLGEAKK
jgi:hypothetical protein